MSTRKKVEILKDLNGEKELVYPLVEAKDVLMDDNRSLEEALSQDISQAVVEHSKSTFKSGAGDNIDVSNSIVDGEPSQIKIEGQTFQNVLGTPEIKKLIHAKPEFNITEGQPTSDECPVNISENSEFKELKIMGQTIKNMTDKTVSHEFSVENEEMFSTVYNRDEKIDYIDDYDDVIIKGKSVVNMLAETCGTPVKTVENEKDIIPVINSDLDINTTDGLYHENILYGKTLKNELVPANTEVEEIHKNKRYSNELGIKVSDNINFDMAVVKGKTLVNCVKESTQNTDYISLDQEYQGESIKIDGTEKGNLQNVLLEGLTLANTIQESSESDATVLELDADINAKTVDINNTVQGGIHGAKLVGQTIVRLNYDTDPAQNAETNDIICSYDYTNNIYTYGRKEGSTVNIYPSNLTLIRCKIRNPTPGQVYTFILTQLTGGKTKFGIRIFYDTATTSNNSYVPQDETLKNGIHKFVFTFPSDLTLLRNFQLRLLESETNDTITFKDMLLLEGDYSEQDIDYRIEEGIQSVEVPSVKTIGKNLFDGNFTVGDLSLDNGSFSYNENWAVTDYIKVSNMQDIIFNSSVPFSLSNFVYFKYDKDKKFLGYTGEYSSNTTATISLGDNVHYVRLRVPSAIPSNSEFQIETGSTATSYEPYKSSTLTTPSDVVLRKIGDIQDELDLETGKLTQRIGEIALDGSEQWGIATQNYSDGYIYQTKLSLKSIEKNNILCDKLQVKNIWAENSGNGITINTSLTHLQIKHSKITTVDDFKAWLASSPITIQYGLEDPIVKTVDLSIVDQDNKTVKSIQTHPTITHVSTSSQGLIPSIVIPSQLKYSTIIKPSTTYTVQLKYATINSDNPLIINLGGITMAVPSTKFTITTPETLTSQDVFFTGKNNVISEVVITEGDTTNINYNYFEGINNVKMNKAIIRGKNLFDGILAQGYIEDSTGLANVSMSGIHSPNYIRINPNTTYIRTLFGDKTGEGVARVYFYDLNKNYLNYYTSNETFISPENAYYIRFRYFTDNGTITLNDFKNCTIQIEEGSTATTYEPYQYNAVNPIITLRSLPNSVKDTLNLSTGEYIQQIGEINTKDLTVTSIETGENTTNLLNITISDSTYAETFDLLEQQKVIICDKLPILDNGGNTWILAENTNKIFKTTSANDTANQLCLVVPNNINTIELGNQYLQQIDAIIQYKLVQPVITYLDLIEHLQTFNEVTHFDSITENLLPNIVIPKEVSYPALIKSSTKYLVDINRINKKSCTINVGGTDLEFTNEETRKTITTPSILTNENILYYGMNAKNNKLLLIEYQEGMENWDLNYFEGMQSVVNPEVVICNSPMRFGKGGRL